MRRSGGASPGRELVVDEVGKVGGGIVRVRSGHGGRILVRGMNSVADELTMLVKAGGDGDCEGVIASDEISIGAVISHGERGPSCLIARIVDFNVIAWGNELIV